MKNAVCIALFLTLLGTSSAFAVPASPFPMEVKQPDGTVLELYRKGDEACNWVETADGYSVIHNPESGYWEYAQTSLQALELFPSGVVAEKGVRPPAHIKKGIAPVSFVPYGPPQRREGGRCRNGPAAGRKKYRTRLEDERGDFLENHARRVSRRPESEHGVLGVRRTGTCRRPGTF